MGYINFEDFKKLDIRIGTIKAVKDHPDAENLYIILVDFGEEETDRQIIASIKKDYKKADLIGKQIAVIVNLKPVMLRGLESNGMLLAAVNREDKVILLCPEKKIDNNSRVL